MQCLEIQKHANAKEDHGIMSAMSAMQCPNTSRVETRHMKSHRLQALRVLSGSNVLPGEGVDTDYPVMRLAMDIVLGAAQHLTSLKKKNDAQNHNAWRSCFT